ncbi:MAG: hypothetical protein ACK6AD_07165 [Cyanobacteriota bacterium]|jgi:hypothetical protein
MRPACGPGFSPLSGGAETLARAAQLESKLLACRMPLGVLLGILAQLEAAMHGHLEILAASARLASLIVRGEIRPVQRPPAWVVPQVHA